MTPNRQRVQSVASACLAWTMVASASGASGGSSAPSDPGSVLLSIKLPDRPTSGARLFLQKKCSRCHSVGQPVSSGPRIGPDLGRLVVSGSVMDLAGAFWNHAPVMRERMRALNIEPPTMTSGNIADIVAFLAVYRPSSNDAARPGRESAGRIVFQTKGCAGCHAVDGRRWTGPGPGLQKYRGRSSAVFLAQAMWNHGPQMASVMRARAVSWPTFAPGEMDDLVAFLQGGTRDDAAYFDPGSPRRGAELFSSKRCVACHAIRDRGGHGGPDLGLGRRDLVASVPTIAGLMWNHSEDMASEFKRRGIPQIRFSGQEMADIIAYLYFINYATVRATPARGEQVFASKCVTCHGTPGRKVGPDLTAIPHLDDPLAIIAAMWNHAPMMIRTADERKVPWPRFEPGQAADLTAFLLATRADR